MSPILIVMGLFLLSALLFVGCGSDAGVEQLAADEGLNNVQPGLPPPPPVPPLFVETFVDNSQGWTLGTEWEIGPAFGFTTTEGNQEPGTDHTPTGDNGIAGVIIGGQYNDASPHAFYYLTSPPIDASGIVGTLDLQFFRWLNSDYVGYITNAVEVFDGSVWQTIWSGEPGWIADGAWTQFNFNVTPFANPNFRVRFGFDMAGGAITDGGWNLDDVSLTEL